MQALQNEKVAQVVMGGRTEDFPGDRRVASKFAFTAVRTVPGEVWVWGVIQLADRKPTVFPTKLRCSRRFTTIR